MPNAVIMSVSNDRLPRHRAWWVSDQRTSVHHALSGVESNHNEMHVYSMRQWFLRYTIDVIHRNANATVHGEDWPVNEIWKCDRSTTNSLQCSTLHAQSMLQRSRSTPYFIIATQHTKRLMTHCVEQIITRSDLKLTVHNPTTVCIDASKRISVITTFPQFNDDCTLLSTSSISNCDRRKKTSQQLHIWDHDNAYRQYLSSTTRSHFQYLPGSNCKSRRWVVICQREQNSDERVKQRSRHNNYLFPFE